MIMLLFPLVGFQWYQIRGGIFCTVFFWSGSFVRSIRLQPWWDGRSRCCCFRLAAVCESQRPWYWRGIGYSPSRQYAL